MEQVEHIYKENGYINIRACATYEDIKKSKYINNNLYGLIESIKNEVNQNINEGFCNGKLLSPIIYPLLTLNAFIEIDNNEYDRIVLLKNLIKNRKELDLKDGETIINVFFKEPEKNQIISFNKIDFKNENEFYISTFLEIYNEKVQEIYISSNFTENKPKRDVTIELMLIDKKINDRIINSACRTMNILAKKNLNYMNIKDIDRYIIIDILKDSIKECIYKLK